jgi:hypothetical protein
LNLKKHLSILIITLIFSVSGAYGQVEAKAQVYDSNRCPVFQNGAPGSPNAYVTFFDANHVEVVTCFCQLTGNELKCHNCKPPDPDWLYYQVVIPPDTLDTLNCYSPAYLSVDLLSFSAYEENGEVYLMWETNNEIDNSHFEIVRSSDGNSETSVAKVKGMRNTQTITTYRYMDQYGSDDEPYYRLRQVDYDGLTTLSRWIRVNRSYLGDRPALISPNPSKGLLNVHILKEAGFETATIMDFEGRILREYQLKSGDNTFETELNPGKYLIQIVGPVSRKYMPFMVY